MSLPPTVDFERMCRTRFGRVVAAMERRGVDLLLLSRSANANYVSGARRVQVAGSGGFVPWAVVRAGEPAPWVYTPDLDGVPAWMNGRGRPLLWDPARLVADIRAIGGEGRTRLAADVVSPRFLRMLEAAFPEAVWLDGDVVVAEAREVKDADELACVEHAARVARATLARVIGAVRPGARERDLAAVYLEAAIEEGAGFLAHEGSFRVSGAGAPPGRLTGERALREGDLVSLEVAVVVAGYQGESAATVAHGDPSPGIRALARRWREGLAAIVSACRAGADEATIRAALPRDLSGTPYLLHGIGTGVEAPVLDLRGDAAGFPLRSGMTLVLTPAIFDPVAGSIRGSETVVVGSAGARSLSPALVARAAAAVLAP